jgi:hypothetical protein
VSETKVLIIWGMHRSGTSLLASWLHACGLDLGSELLGKGVGNERGHFEDMDFLNLHEKCLKANGIGCGGLLKTGPLQLSDELLEEMRALVARKCQRAQWGWKEPRTCLFVDEYFKLLPQARHLVVYRHYELVIDSLVRRRMKNRLRRTSKKPWLKRLRYALKYQFWKCYQLPAEANQYLASWIKYNQNLLQLIRMAGTENVVVMDCRDFVTASVPAFAQLRDWGFVLQRQPAENYVEPSMIADNPSQEFTLNASLQTRADGILLQLKQLAIESEVASYE